MPTVKSLDSTSQLLDHYVECAIRFAKASRQGREKGDQTQATVASNISGSYMNKIKMLKQASL